MKESKLRKLPEEGKDNPGGRQGDTLRERQGPYCADGQPVVQHFKFARPLGEG